MILIDRDGKEVGPGDMVTEHNAANGRMRDGWIIDQVVSRGVAVMVKVVRDCQHLEKGGECNHDWCSGKYSKMVYLSTLRLRVVRDVVATI